MNIKINKNIARAKVKLPETTPLTLYLKIVFPHHLIEYSKDYLKPTPI